MRCSVSPRRTCDAGEEQPVGLLGVEPPVARLDLGQPGQDLADPGGDLVRDRADVVADRQVAAQPVDQRAQQPDAVHRLEGQHLAGRRGSDVGVAVAVAADPRAEAERAYVGRQVDPERHQPVAQLLEHVGQGAGREALEVVDDVAGLVGRLGRLDPDLVGEPQQLDRLLEPAGPPRAVGLLQQRGDATQLVDRRAAGDLGRVGGEDRAHGDLLEQRRDLVGVDRRPRRSGRRPARASRPPRRWRGSGRGRGGPAR